MKIINNTCKQVLPSLLDKTKIRTTRISKGEPKYKLGQEVRLLWSGDMKYYHKLTNCEIIHELNIPISLGKVKIIEIIKLKIAKIPEEEYGRPNLFSAIVISGFKGCLNMDKFAKQDGFKDFTELCLYLDKQYGLDTPKEFYSYKWEYKR